jgi:hypothetical protein
MHNYHNILPTIIIDVLIILVFEGLLFFLYLAKEQERIVNNQIDNAMVELHNVKTQQLKEYQNIFSFISNKIQPYIEKNMVQEKNYNDKQYKLGLIYYFLSLLVLIITLVVYSYIVVYILGKSIDWKIVLITVFITILLIIILEVLYVKYVLFNKKFNESQIELDFINALVN